MANRLSKIVTRTGDKGTTGLGDGSRVTKTDPRIQAIGDVDELNSQIGVALCEPMPQSIREILQTVQNDLFDLGGELSVPGVALLKEAQLTCLDKDLAHWSANLPPLREFVLPGGCRGAALLHVARTVCRRAERSVVALGEGHSALALRYLNRLSDLLFMLARVLNRGAGMEEMQWKKRV
ncbi:cob(I)alamin adenosyltransferase [Formivibrio citricus]|uniref:Cobalamin adenosyltransferase n=1 Tax=Formivibrio citricus TaxID=83765 RepID=A0A1I4Y7M6_9NEIS|nr:cob(I)yrinic acid a,c-diamide adenosyltransferase [Formivibrio citricus]SFN34017.1 cob(I)alamin adenosyltransferase [Formivibrio citricus]